MPSQLLPYSIFQPHIVQLALLLLHTTWSEYLATKRRTPHRDDHLHLRVTVPHILATSPGFLRQHGLVSIQESKRLVTCSHRCVLGCCLPPLAVSRLRSKCLVIDCWDFKFLFVRCISCGL